jgi:hypothetical protein
VQTEKRGLLQTEGCRARSLGGGAGVDEEGAAAVARDADIRVDVVDTDRAARRTAVERACKHVHVQISPGVISLHAFEYNCA